MPYISDVSYTISAIRDLVLCDITTSDEKKDALLTHFDNAPAHFICDVLIYGVSRNFVKVGNKDSGSASPRVDDAMYLPLLPKPTKYFTGRSNALLELYQLLYISCTCLSALWAICFVSIGYKKSTQLSLTEN